MELNTIMVIGAGQMGAGIAQVCAQANYHVILHDINEANLTKAYSLIEQNLLRDVKKERITEKKKYSTLKQIQLSTSFTDAKLANFIIEAVTENIDLKKDIFKQLDNLVPKETVLATNTSSLPITEIAAITDRPDQVIGMHFMNPVPVMKLVEIIRGLQTSDKTYETVTELAQHLNKVSVEVKDFPGFVANRILLPMINEAIYTLYEGIATREHIDTVMKLGTNHPMGPLELADFIGLDTCLAIMNVLYDGFNDSKYRPCPLLKQYVQAGWLGRKTGRGFYTYN